jgi:hypothetical protein
VPAFYLGTGDKTRSHVVAEERKLCAVGTVGDRQRAAGVAAVLGIRQRRVEAEGDARQTGSRRRNRDPGSLAILAAMRRASSRVPMRTVKTC